MPGARRDGRTAPQVPPTGRRRSHTSTFAALRVRNYRLFFAGQVVSNTGTWMQRIAQDWLVLQITNSPLAVGITTALQFLPMLLFGLWGGLLVDRYPKRMLLLITQTVMGALAVALAVLTLTGAVQVWQVYLIALGLGFATVVDNPARQTFVNEMVPKELVRNAVGLNSGNFQLARMLGPAVAGVLISAVGIGYAFALNALSFVAVITALLLMRNSELLRTPLAPRGPGQLREGLRYVRQDPGTALADRAGVLRRDLRLQLRHHPVRLHQGRLRFRGRPLRPAEHRDGRRFGGRRAGRRPANHGDADHAVRRGRRCRARPGAARPDARG